MLNTWPGQEHDLISFLLGSGGSTVFTLFYFQFAFSEKKLFLAEGICFVYATFWSRTLLTHWRPAIKLQQHKVYVALWQEFAYIRLVMQNVCGPNLLLSLFTLLEIQLIEYKLENELVTFVDYIINNFTLSWRQVIDHRSFMYTPVMFKHIRFKVYEL